MSFFKKLFGKKDQNSKKNSETNKETKKKSAHSDPIPPTSPIPPAPSKSIEEQEREMQEGIKEMFEESKTYKRMQAMAKGNAIKDEDLIKQSMDKIFPRLKRGSIENATGQVMTMKTKDGLKEVNIPPELMLAGYDSGPDFFTSFAIDNDAMFTMIYNKHITLSGMTKKELLLHACQNFQQKIGPISKVTKTIFPNVYQIQTDGNSEASTFLFPHIWNNIKDQLGLSKLFMIMPAQNTVLFWESISDKTLADMKEKVSAEVATYPAGSIVSNYLYELRENAFVHLNQVFEIKI